MAVVQRAARQYGLPHGLVPVDELGDHALELSPCHGAGVRLHIYRGYAVGRHVGVKLPPLQETCDHVQASAAPIEG